MFADPKAKVSCLGEIPLLQLIFLDLQSSLKNFLGFGSTDGDVHGDLLITTDTECSDCVAGFA